LSEIGIVKFLVDESVGIAVSQKLKQMNFDAVSVIQFMKGAGDEEIMRKAIEENRVIITNDKDFGWLASFYKPLGIILLRLKDERAENKVRMVSYIIKKYREVILGSILVASEKKIRIRRLE
jgi:predicted nuclease of predicted toxin-antitoxin system